MVRVGQINSIKPMACCPDGDCNEDVCVSFTPQYAPAGFWYAPFAAPPCPGNSSEIIVGHGCLKPVLTGYAIAASGGPAKAGDACNGSPQTIGSFLGANPPYSNVYNITEVVMDSAFNTSAQGWNTVGWVYLDQNGQQWFQGSPNVTVGVAAGVISWGVAASSGVAPINPSNWLQVAAFNILNNYSVIIHGYNGGGKIHTRPCFTQSWNGSFN
jgi:hypothetical protein